MKTKTFSPWIVALAALPGMAIAQIGPTYLSAPDGNPTNALIVAPGGNVGVGTTSPIAKLQVNGPLIVGSYAGFYPHAVSIGASGGNYGSVGYGYDYTDVSGTYLYAGFDTASQLRFDGGGFTFATAPVGSAPGVVPFATAMTIKQDGNVGIGTTTPEEGLHVRGSILVEGTGGAGRIAMRGTAPGGHQYEWYPDRVAAGYLTLFDRTAIAERLVVDPSGNVGIGTTSPKAKLDVNGKINCTVLELTSDRNSKAGFAPVNNREVLDKVARLPITTWHYTNAPGIRHIGPMAQDWKVAFPDLGSDDKHIAAGDLGSVALAALQGLNEKLVETLKEKDTEIVALKRELHALKSENANFVARFEKLEKLMAMAFSDDIIFAHRRPLTVSESGRPIIAASYSSTDLR